MNQTCRVCKKTKPLAAYSLRSDSQIPHTVCRSCRADDARARRRVQNGLTPERPAVSVASVSHETRSARLAEHLRHENGQLRQLLLDQQARLDLYEEIASIRSEEPRIFATQKTPAKKREATACVVFSDWHIEEPVTLEKTNGLNEYDIAIANERIDRLVLGIENLVAMHEEMFEIKDLVIMCLGDLFSGYIHEELTEEAQLSPVESVLWLDQALRGVIDRMLRKFEHITVECRSGNHGRTTKKRRIATNAENSFEWLLYQFLARHYEKEPRVTIRADKALQGYLHIYDRTIRTLHGDDVRYSGGVGGLEVPLKKALTSWDQGRRADYSAFGHWHTLMFGKNFVGNGSLIGHNPFAISIKAQYEPPRQAFFLVDSKEGMCCTNGIWVDQDTRRSVR